MALAAQSCDGMPSAALALAAPRMLMRFAAALYPTPQFYSGEHSNEEAASPPRGDETGTLTGLASGLAQLVG